MPTYEHFADPVRIRRWKLHVDEKADLSTLLDELIGHAVALREALYSGTEATSVFQDRSLMLVAVINRLREIAELR